MTETRGIAEHNAQDPGSAVWPIELAYRKSDRVLTIAWDNGERHELPAELLRVESPSAEVQGHGPSQKQLISGRSKVGITAVEPVGNYAVRLRFDDLHDTGIFSWQYLYRLGRERETIWQAYLDALSAKGLSREPPRRA